MKVDNYDKFLLCLKLSSQENFDDAIEIYKDIYKTGTKKDVFNYVFCLNKVNKLDKAIEISKELHKKYPDYKTNNNYLSFLIYQKYFRNLNLNSKTNIDKILDISISIFKITNQDIKSSCNIILDNLLKFLKNKNLKSSNKILIFLELVDFKKLTNLSEDYFLFKSKILFELEQYENCIICCDNAIKFVVDFHHNNLSWIISRKAKSLAKIHEYERAIYEFENIYSLTSHWTTYFDIAEIFFNLENYEKASLFYFKACITSKKKGGPALEEISVKVKTYSKLAELLYILEDYETSWQHILFAINIRNTKNWNIPEHESKLYFELLQYNFSSHISHQQLILFWIKQIYEILGHYKGIITHIDYVNFTGHLTHKDELYEFNTRNIFANRKLIINENVWFCLEKNSIVNENADLICSYILPIEL